MTDQTLGLEDFVAGFFGNGNRFTREMIEDPDQDSEGLRYVRARIEDLRRNSGLPIILPRVGEDVVWYAMASSDRQLRRVGRELAATIGPSYSDFVPVPAEPNASDPADPLVRQMSAAGYLCFRTPPELVASSVIPALSTLYELWSRQPTRRQDLVRPPGHVLRDFRFAIAQGNESVAFACLQELRNRRALNATNLEFLQIELLSGLGRHASILELPTLAKILQIRRPLPVSNAILSAVFHVHLASCVSVEDAMAEYTASVGPELRQMARSPIVTNALGPAVVLLIEALSSGAVNRRPLEHILNSPWQLEEVHYLRELLAKVAALISRGSRTSHDLDRLIREGRYEEAYQSASAPPDNAQRVRVQMTAAYEMSDRGMACEALRRFRSLEHSAQESLSCSRLVSLQILYLEELCTELPSDWLSWFRSLDADSSEASMRRLASALADWPPLIDERAYEPLRQELERSRSREATSRISESLPLLLEQVLKDPLSVGLRLTILDHLVVESAYTVPVLEAMLSILDSCLGDGVTEEQYVQALANAQDVWDIVRSPRRAAWLADLLGILLFNPAPVQETRRGLLGRAFDWLGRNWSELGPELTDRVIALAAKADPDTQDSLPPRASESPPNTHYPPGLRVGIYSLQSGSARAAKDVLERAHPTIKVTLNSDHQASTALAAMARNCDYVIASWSNAKHAATDFLKGKREGGGGKILWARGGGASSLLAALEDALRDGPSDVGL